MIRKILTMILYGLVAYGIAWVYHNISHGLGTYLIILWIVILLIYIFGHADKEEEEEEEKGGD